MGLTLEDLASLRRSHQAPRWQVIDGEIHYEAREIGRWITENLSNGRSAGIDSSGLAQRA